MSDSSNSSGTSNTNLVSKCRSQKFREENIKALVAYFESGATPNEERVGIELEHIIVEEKTDAPVSYSQEHGVLWVLEQLRPDFDEPLCDQKGDLLGLTKPGVAITLEPAAQLEISAGPFEDLSDADIVLENFENQLASILSPQGKQALTLGYHPSARAVDLELIPKRRYKFMNLYLGDISKYGPCMMKGSASTQVSIDYHSVDDCLRKLKIAYALVPLFSLICDNSPIFEGGPRTHKLVRTKIWQECDPARCGLVPNIMESDFTLRDYAEYILDTPAILMPCKTNEWCYSENTFGSIYAEKIMELKDVEHAVSMFFNDVRLKTYIEIRPADAMPIPYVLAYAALIKGLFYNEENLVTLEQLFEGVDASSIDTAKDALMREGYAATIYGRPVSELTDCIQELAYAALSEQDQNYLAPLSKLIEQRLTLADLAEQKK